MLCYRCWFCKLIIGLVIYLEVQFYVIADEVNQKAIHHRLSEEVSYGFADLHLWWSVIDRPPLNSFNRTQRLACATAVMFGFMFGLCAWYYFFNFPTVVDRTLGIAKIEWSDITAGILVAVVVSPLGWLLFFFFKLVEGTVSAYVYFYISVSFWCICLHLCVCVCTWLSSILIHMYDGDGLTYDCTSLRLTYMYIVSWIKQLWFFCSIQ